LWQCLDLPFFLRGGGGEIQGDQKVSLRLIITIQKVTSNVHGGNPTTCDSCSAIDS
jgi:hypothetical protein